MASDPPAFLHEDPFPTAPRTSSWSTIASGSTHNRNKSNNPYRQAREIEAERSISARQKTPARAVFDDLLTAHSSITSRKVDRTPRTKTSDATSNSLDEEEDSIPLQELDSADRPVDFFRNMPLPPLPAVLSSGRRSQEDDGASDDHLLGSNRGRLSQTLPPIALGPSISMFTSIKNALTGISSPLTRDDISDRPTSGMWPRNSFDLEDNVKRRSLRRTQSSAEQGPGDKRQEPLTYGIAISTNIRHPANQSSVYQSTLGRGQARSLPSSSQPLNHYNITNSQGTGGADDNEESLLDFSLPPRQTRKQPFKLHDTRSLSNDGSLPEGSTVGNIYKHYVRSDGLEQFSDDEDNDVSETSLPDLRQHSARVFDTKPSVAVSMNSLATDQLRPSALLIRKQRRADKAIANMSGPPKFPLPQMPDYSSHHLMPSSSRGIVNSSSYGDTHKLLEITQPTNWANMRKPFSRSDARHDLQSDQGDMEEGEASRPDLSKLNSKNPFNDLVGPQVVISSADDGILVSDNGFDFDHPITERTPLEREVSEALRRASGYSAYSNGSIGSSLLDRYEEVSVLSTSKSIGLLRRQKVEDTPPSDTESMGDDTRAIVDQARAFYDPGAIAPRWLTTRQQNVVRVPINHNGSMPDSPPDSPPHDAETPYRKQQTPDDDHNDWETVGESAFGLDRKSTYKDTGLIGGTVNRAGSSIANTSDEGTISTHVPEIEDFGSTERIAQHPGNIRYFGDYRQRDLKKTNIPVFLPVFRDHKVNGYLADSNRMRPPPPPFNVAAPQLDKGHKNPFQSSPPEVKPTIRSVRPSGMPQHQRGRNHFHPSLQTVQTENNTTEDRIEEQKGHARRRTHDWMDEFGDPGPAINHQSNQLRNRSPERPSSWKQIMALASGNDIAGGNIENSSIARDAPKPNFYRSKLFGQHKQAGRNQTDGLGEAVSIAGGTLINKKTRNRAPFVKGPPGAFYQGLRSKPSNSKRRTTSERENPFSAPSRKPSAKEYPTNTLRPLSLLRDVQPMTPTTPSELPSSEDNLGNDFVYRSPLAPPKHKSWRKLYSVQQLQRITEAAKADGLVVDTQGRGVTGLIKDPLKDVSSRKHLFETPTLRLWKRDDSTRTDLSHRKKNVSITVLCFCAFFPPLLVLYALGSLDGIIAWWTEGHYTAFAKQQKRWAYILMSCWGATVFLGLIAFLVYWFSSRRSS